MCLFVPGGAAVAGVEVNNDVLSNNNGSLDCSSALGVAAAASRNAGSLKILSGKLSTCNKRKT